MKTHCWMENTVIQQWLHAMIKVYFSFSHFTNSNGCMQHVAYVTLIFAIIPKFVKWHFNFVYVLWKFKNILPCLLQGVGGVKLNDVFCLANMHQNNLKGI